MFKKKHLDWVEEIPRTGPGVGFGKSSGGLQKKKKTNKGSCRFQEEKVLGTPISDRDTVAVPKISPPTLL